jgi:hypothetical protein
MILQFDFLIAHAFSYRDWEDVSARKMNPPQITPWENDDQTKDHSSPDASSTAGKIFTSSNDPLPVFASTSPSLRQDRLRDFQTSTNTPLSTTVGVISEPMLQFDDFDLLEVLGVGAWGKVFRVRNKLTGKVSALKVIAKELLTRDDEDKVMAELQALRRLVGVNGFLQLEASFHDSVNYYILTVRLCSCGRHVWLTRDM